MVTFFTVQREEGRRKWYDKDTEKEETGCGGGGGGGGEYTNDMIGRLGSTNLWHRFV